MVSKFVDHFDISLVIILIEQARQDAKLEIAKSDITDLVKDLWPLCECGSDTPLSLLAWANRSM